MSTNNYPVQVCPDCDIADCHHIRKARAPQAGVSDEHEAFDEFCVRQGLPRTVYQDDARGYSNERTKAAYAAWQARAALAQTEQPEAAEHVVPALPEAPKDHSPICNVLCGMPYLGCSCGLSAPPHLSHEPGDASKKAPEANMTRTPSPLEALIEKSGLAGGTESEDAGLVADAQPRLKARLTKFPESNGKTNWTALLVREEPWDGLAGNCGGISLARGELWNRVAWEAEQARYLIGARDTEPDILDYGDDIKTPDDWKGEGQYRAIRAARQGGE